MRIGEYETHPAADVFPLMEGAEFEALIADITEHGLREPIVRVWVPDPIAPASRVALVLDGRNRLRACIAAKVKPEWREYEGDAPMAFVWSMNFARRHLAPGAEALCRARALPMFKAEAKARQVRKPESVLANLPEQNRGTARDKAASGGGVSGRTIQHAATVLEKAVPEVVRAVERGEMAVSAAAELSSLSDEKQRAVLEKTSGKPGNVRALVRQIEKQAVGAKLNAEPAPMPAGPYRVLVADPPWNYEKRAGDATHRGDLPYPSMTTDAICEMAVRGLGCDESILWLWTTNAFMRDAYRVLDAWGYQEKTILTWVKDRVGLGDWLRGKTEHCILAVRGKPTVTLTNETTVLDAARREHSRKPDEFYALVEALCPGSKVELFAREARPGWAAWGAETGKFAGAAE